EITAISQERDLMQFVLESDYGGDQFWYRNNDFFIGSTLTPETRQRMDFTGCGSIAATNIIYYYAQNFNEAFAQRVTKRSRILGTPTFESVSVNPNREEFINFAVDIYNNYTKQTFLVPYSVLRGVVRAVSFGNVQLPETPGLGIWYISTICDGIVSFARERGVSLRSHTMQNPVNILQNPINSVRDAANFIIKGLENNLPVVLLVTFNDYIREFPKGSMVETHFVTITSIKKKTTIERTIFDNGGITERVLDSEEDYELVISNWGERQIIPSLKEMWLGTPTWFNALKMHPTVSILTRGIASVSLGYCSFR
ncbi:MAG: hypothetical protein FWD82_07635, partial [Defluviitaleaceae bacterium]|nr:hypothetical protein [Defluviitaleaceae bacterium]